MISLRWKIIVIIQLILSRENSGLELYLLEYQINGLNIITCIQSHLTDLSGHH